MTTPATDVSKPRRRTIVAAQGPLLEQLHVDPRRATNACWRCGHRDQRLRPERAHIVPARYGARENQPRNYLLLCHECHGQQPDARPWPEQLAWLLTRDGRRRSDA